MRTGLHRGHHPYSPVLMPEVHKPVFVEILEVMPGCGRIANRALKITRIEVKVQRSALIAAQVNRLGLPEIEGQSDLITWVKRDCVPVPLAEAGSRAKHQQAHAKGHENDGRLLDSNPPRKSV